MLILIAAMFLNRLINFVKSISLTIISVLSIILLAIYNVRLSQKNKDLSDENETNKKHKQQKDDWDGRGPNAKLDFMRDLFKRKS